VSQPFYSNGKVLITGEYAVLDGAKALALPTKYGQNLIVESGTRQSVVWKSYDHNHKIWFEDTFTFAAIAALQLSGNKDRDTLLTILHEAFAMNPTMKNEPGFEVATHLNFPRNWGLGTSSTLINNIAQWFGIDAYELLWKSFGGSGYDIASAQHNKPIVYQLQRAKPVICEVPFNPRFKNHLYFVYLNQKQSSKEAIAAYKQLPNKASLLSEINLITQAVLTVDDAHDFAALLENHEAIMAQILKLEPVKKKLFPDFEGCIKSLGAWGGDFVLVVAPHDPTAYFRNKGFDTVLRYQDMIL